MLQTRHVPDGAQTDLLEQERPSEAVDRSESDDRDDEEPESRILAMRYGNRSNRTVTAAHIEPTENVFSGKCSIDDRSSSGIKNTRFVKQLIDSETMAARGSISIFETDEFQARAFVNTAIQPISRCVVLETDGTKGNRNGRSKELTSGRVDPGTSNSQFP